jgi:hypothetical protein
MAANELISEMSLEILKQVIYCDGESCESTTLPPVGLRVSAGDTQQSEYRASGWVFIIGQGGQGKELHFCPACAPRYLAAFRSDKTPPDSQGDRKSSS